MERLLHYELSEKLGHGKNGDAFQALDTGLNRPVVVKLLSSDIPRDDRWQEDYRTLSEQVCVLHHPNVGPVYGLEIDGDTLFVVRDYFDGETVADLAADHQFDYPRFLKVAHAAAAGLQALHERGLIHGNIRTSNVWLEESGAVVLSDPGLQIPFEPNNGDDYPIDEMMYLAPEQLTGGAATIQTDIYCLGIVLYQLLTGEFPFQGESARQLQQSIRTAPINYSGPAGKFAPPEAHLLINKLLSRDLTDRFADVDRVQATLTAMQDFVNDRAPEAPPGRRGWSTRQSVTVAMAVLAAIVVWFILGIVTD